MNTAIITALITSFTTIVGVVITNSKQSTETQKNLEIKLSEFKNDLQSQITILKDSFARMESRQEKQEEIVEKLKDHGTRIAILEEKQKNCESKCNNN
jgi:uncharacterized membrane-anchored protein YhcB (DUF1043 family)